jgi:hypothetical protein
MGSLVLNGATSGSTTLTPTDAVTATLTLPSTSGTVLTTTSPKTGNVIQVVTAVVTSSQSTTSTTYVDVTGLTASITPSSSSSKILVKVCLNNVGTNTASIVYFNLLRGSTTLINNTSGGGAQTATAWFSAGQGGLNDNSRKTNSGSLEYLDSPSTTSSTTYKVQMKVNGDTGYFNQSGINTEMGTVSSIVLMEIAG